MACRAWHEHRVFGVRLSVHPNLSETAQVSELGTIQHCLLLIVDANEEATLPSVHDFGKSALGRFEVMAFQPCALSSPTRAQTTRSVSLSCGGVPTNRSPSSESSKTRFPLNLNPGALESISCPEKPPDSS